MPSFSFRCQASDDLRCDEPVWQPLLDAVGERLTETFMWMYCVDLQDGTTVHAYKHIHTRAYLFLNDEGKAHQWTPCHRYARQRLDWAIEAALCQWFLLDGMEDGDAEAIRAAVLRANAADRGEAFSE